MVSTHRFFDFGCVFTNSEPPPGPFISRTTFQAFSLCFSGSVPITLTFSLPSALVTHTGPNFGSVKFAPRPGCGILLTSISAVVLRSFESITAILFDWFAAVMK